MASLMQTGAQDAAALFSAAEAHCNAGRPGKAEELCRQILLTHPEHAAALHLLGILAHQKGQKAQAIALFRRAIASDGEVALYHCNLAEVCRLSGDCDTAIAEGHRALALKPDYAVALNNLGNAYSDKGEYDAAVDCYRRALALAPAFAVAHSNLGNVLRLQKKPDEAVAAQRNAIAHSGNFAGAYNGLGSALFDLKDYPAAIAAFEHAIALQPNFADAYNNLGSALRAAERLDDARIAYNKAYDLTPNDAAILNNLALVAIENEDFHAAIALLTKSNSLRPDSHETFTYLANAFLHRDEDAAARQACERALALRPGHPQALIAMGNILMQEGRVEDALPILRQAEESMPDNVDCIGAIGRALRELGQLEEARIYFERAYAMKPDSTGFLRSLMDLRTLTPEDAYFLQAEKLAETIDTLTPERQAQLHFALGKAYGDFGRHALGLDHLKQGNAIQRGLITYDEARQHELFRRIQTAFSAELIAKKSGQGLPSRLPVLIIGMPRSGTTLMEQVLASHPRVFGAGECAYLNELAHTARIPGGSTYPEYARVMEPSDLRALGEAYLKRLRDRANCDADRIVDKMPGNYMYAGLFHLALPQGRIIHMRRDPVDTCLSCFSQLFAKGNLPQTFELGELGRYYRKYEELMAHWRRVLPAGVMIDVQYEDLVQDFEPQVRRILAHCELDWDEACVNFQDTRRPVRTASVTQVRKPLYQSSVGRWRNYQDGLAPLLDALGIVP